MPDIYETEPATKWKIRWQGGSLDNTYFGAKGGLFYGSRVKVDENNAPIKGTEERLPARDFSITVTNWVDGAELPTPVGMKNITFTDPVTGLEHTCSYVAIMRAMGEIVSTEGNLKFNPPPSSSSTSSTTE